MFTTGRGATVVVSADARAKAAALFASSPLADMEKQQALPEGIRPPSPVALPSGGFVSSAACKASTTRHPGPSTFGQPPPTSGFLTGNGKAVVVRDQAAMARMREMLLASPDGPADDATAGAPARRSLGARTEPSVAAGGFGAGAGTGGGFARGVARPLDPDKSSLGVRPAAKAFQTASGARLGVGTTGGGSSGGGTAATGAVTTGAAATGAAANVGVGGGGVATVCAVVCTARGGALVSRVPAALNTGIQRSNPALSTGKPGGFKKPRTSTVAAMGGDATRGPGAAAAAGRSGGTAAARRPRFVAPRSNASCGVRDSTHEAGVATAAAAVGAQPLPPPPRPTAAAPAAPEHCTCAVWAPLHLRGCPTCCPGCGRPLARNGELCMHATHCLNGDAAGGLLKR